MNTNPATRKLWIVAFFITSVALHGQGPAVAAVAGAPAAPTIDTPVTAGDTHITVKKNAVAGSDYDLYKCKAPAPGAAAPAVGAAVPGSCVKIGVATASSTGSLDFTNVSQAPDVNDSILLSLVGGPIVATATAVAAENQEPPSVIVGYEQSGANSANSSGRLFVDSYYGRAISSKHPLRIFGEVRIGSSAQNSSSTIGTFVTGLSGTASTLKLNQVASVAEFLTGMEYSFLQSHGAKPARMAVFGEYGASGNLQASELNNTYAFPPTGTQAYTLLVAAEKSTQGPNPATSIPTTCVEPSGSTAKITGVSDNCMFIQFSQQQPYFDQEGYVGLRSVSFLTSGGSAAPDTISIGFGANHAVNRDMSFNALRVDGFMPFAIPAASGTKPTVPVIYLFGYANLALDHSQFPNVNNFIPFNAASTVLVNNVAQTPSANNTYVIYTAAQRQEYYSIGVGVDLVNVWSTLFKTKNE